MTENKEIIFVNQQKTNKDKDLQSLLNRFAVGSALATSGTVAMANYDVSKIVDNLGLAVTAAATIGVTWLGFTAGIAIWRNLRAAAK